MVLTSFTALAALAVAILAIQAESRANPLALQALLRKRQQASPTPVPGSPSPSPTNGGGGGQATTPTDLPNGLAPFQDATKLTAWQVIQAHPSFTNLSSIALAHSPNVVKALNSSDPGTNLTVFAPYDLAFEALIKQPLFALANSTDRYDALITQALAYHVSNATSPSTNGRGGGGAIYSDDIPPAPGNLTVPTLASNLNVTLQRANERPAAPVQISQQTITIPTIQVPTATIVRPTVSLPSPTITLPSPTLTPTVTVVRPTPTPTTTGSEPGQTTPTQTATNGAGQAVGGPLPTDGPGVFANDARIIYVNVTLANGVLHVVDRLMSPLFIFNDLGDVASIIPTALPTGTITATR